MCSNKYVISSLAPLVLVILCWKNTFKKLSMRASCVLLTVRVLFWYLLLLANKHNIPSPPKHDLGGCLLNYKFSNVNQSDAVIPTSVSLMTIIFRIENNPLYGLTAQLIQLMQSRGFTYIFLWQKHIWGCIRFGFTAFQEKLF